MKKFIALLTVTFGLTLMSCGNKTSQEVKVDVEDSVNVVSNDTINEEISVEEIEMEVDSIAVE